VRRRHCLSSGTRRRGRKPQRFQLNATSFSAAHSSRHIGLSDTAEVAVGGNPKMNEGAVLQAILHLLN
jgi:hypothetical protein